MSQTNVQILGVKATVTALRAFEPEVLKGMNKQIRASMTRVRDGAKAKYPGGSWSVRVNQSKILGQVVTSGGKATGSWGTSPGGVRAAVFEFLGTSYGGKRPQVVNAIRSLNARYGRPGRFLWASWEQHGPAVLADIERSVRTAESELQARLDAAGEGY